MSNVLNTREPVTLHLKQRDGSVRTVEVRWPNEQEWIRRELARTSAHVRKNEAIDFLDTDMDALDAIDIEIFKSIHVSGDWTEDDALRAIGQLAVGKAEEMTEGWSIVIEVMGVKTVHYMREPSFQVERRWKANEHLTRIRGERTLLIDNLQLADSVYGKLLERAEGFDGPIPIIHKLWVVKAIFARLAKLESSDGDGSGDLDPMGFFGATTEQR